MAVKTFCDRCGEDFSQRRNPRPPVLAGGRYHVTRTATGADAAGLVLGPHDLCEQCASALRRFFEPLPREAAS